MTADLGYDYYYPLYSKYIILNLWHHRVLLAILPFDCLLMLVGASDDGQVQSKNTKHAE